MIFLAALKWNINERLGFLANGQKYTQFYLYGTEL